MWFDRPLSSIIEADLRDLVSNGTVEGSFIDYKNELPAPPKADKDKKSEFLVDVSAFANAGGGTLIYGIEEGPNSAAQALNGVGNIDRDAEENRLRSYLQTGLDPQLPVGCLEFHTVGFAGGTIILARVARSWAGPHMVVADGRFRGTFHVRDGNRNRLLDASGVRAAMVRSQDVPERIRAFRQQRMRILKDNNDPVAYQGGAKMIVHLVSLDSFDRRTSVDARFALQQARDVGLFPFSTTESNCDRRFNVDGVMLVGTTSEKKVALAYVQLYRAGMIEAVDYRLLNSPNRAAKNEFPTLWIEGELMKRLPPMLAYFSKVQLRPPFSLMLSFTGIAGYVHKEERTMNAIEDNAIPYFDRAVVELPELAIDASDLAKPITAMLEPLIHDLWQAGGAPDCPRYENGVYKKPA